MAGHSKWANIKHRKARVDAKRSKVWSKCARAIIVAAKNGGGDPAANLTLRYAIDEAKAANMPKDTIEKAIAKGAGGSEGDSNYEQIVYEGYGVNGVAIMVDCLTDNKNRTVPEVKKIFEKRGGNMGTSGCVSYLFESKGQLYIEKSAVDEEKLMDLALEAGAEDVADEEEAWLVVSDPSDFLAVREALEGANIPIESAEVTMVPTTTVTCEAKEAERVMALVEDLEDHDDVQKVHTNFSA